MKKLIGLILTICLIAGTLTFNVSADSGTYSGTAGEGVFWQYSQGVLSIMGEGDMTRYYDTLGLGYLPWDEHEDKIETVIIGRDVKSVYLTYFEECAYLTDIYYQGQYNDWEEVCDGYFISGVNIHFPGPNSEWITIKNRSTIKDIRSPFMGQHWIFEGNRLIVSGYGYIREGINMLDVPYGAADKVNRLIIEEGITRIEEKVFANLASLTYVEMPDSMEIIDNNAFSGCKKLFDVDLGGVAIIGKYAFSGCINLTNIYVGRNLKKIGKYAFSGCNNVENVYVENAAAWDGVIYENEAANPARNGAVVTMKPMIPSNIGLSTQKPNENGETEPGISDASYKLDTENMIPIVSVRASQAPEEYNSAENAVDGSAYTRWAAYGPADIVFDLGRVQYVECCNTYFWRWEVRSMPYKLYVSVDGIKYEKVYDGISPQGEIENYAPVKKNVRYIKLVIEDPGYNGWMSLNEFVVYSK